MTVLEGKAASPGYARGKAFILKAPDLSFAQTKKVNSKEEKERLHRAIKSSHAELEVIKNSMSDSIGSEFGHIFRAQMTMLEDEDFTDEIEEQITGNSCSAETALMEILTIYSEAFQSMEGDDYNRQRLTDLEDISNRILRNLLGLKEQSLALVPRNSIVVAEDLLPSETAMMNRDNVKGFVTEKGGITSHVAILAKSLSLPASIGVENISSACNQNDDMFLDVSDVEKALIYIKPDKSKVSELNGRMAQFEERRALNLAIKDLEPVTTDNKTVVLSANIGSEDDLESALAFGAKSVGLVRTEFLFLGTSKLPDEERQYEFYKKIATGLNGGMAVIRTLDIGGDKEVPGLNLPREDNPFLGLRGIRVCLKNVDLFKTQLKAIMRAAVYGDIRIMFPMVSDLTEYLKAKEIMAEAAAELDSAGTEYRNDFETGVMIETPAAVLLSDVLLDECDFVSIGTNDLTQYLLSVDRINEGVSEYYRMYSPALFRAIRTVSENAEKRGKWAGICGELAGMPLAQPLLMGLGIIELSMSGQLLPETIGRIRTLSYKECRNLAAEVINMKTEEEIRTRLRLEINQ